VRRHVHRDQRIAELAGIARPSLPFQPDLLTVGDAGGYLYFDLLAGRQMHARLGALRCIGKADGQRRMQILAGRRRAEILRLESSAIETARARAGAGRAAAEHAAQQILESAARSAAAAGALEAVRTEREALEMRAARPAGARARAGMPAEALVSGESRLALGVALAAVERLALVGVAHDLVRRVQLRKVRRGLGIVFVGVRVQLLGELAEGALDLRLARTFGNPQDLIGVAHSSTLRETVSAPSRRHCRRFMGSMWGSGGADATRRPAKRGFRELFQGLIVRTRQAPFCSSQASPCSQDCTVSLT